MPGNEDVEAGHPVKVRDRLMPFTWAWYLTTMSTGGVAVLIGQQPHTFRGLHTIGKIIFIWDLVLFVTITTFTVARFTRQPSLFLRSMRNPAEGLFAPAFLLSLANSIISIQTYGTSSCGPWMIVALRVLFWIYAAIAFLAAIFVYLELFAAERMTDKDALPAWLLPILPIMLTGTVAGSIASSQPSDYRMSILVAGVTFQGLGFWAAISLYGAFISRMMKIGLPAPSLRPGLFVSVAPPAFTCLALINMSQAIPTDTSYFILHPTAIETLQEVALAFGIFLWSLSFWWFCISLVTTIMSIGLVRFHLVWYSTIFPNVGFTIATISIGRGLGSSAILWVGSSMSIILVATYIFILLMQVRAIYRHDILWPGKDEDKET